MSNQMYYSEKELDEKKVREWLDSRTVNIADSKTMNRIY